jgi:ferric-dicitrate binding protein FerR (iron transport regulator)
VRTDLLSERVQSLLDGSILLHEWDELEAVLESDPAARAHYLDMVELHILLGQRHEHKALPGQVVPMERIVARQKRRSLRRAMVVAAALAVLGLVSLWFINLPEAPLARFEVSRGSQFVVTHADRDGDAPGDGSLAVGSRVVLKTGALEVNFGSGVRGVVRAPADLTLRSESSVDLAHGTAWFEVLSDQAIGFQVSTPEFLLTDLGTEFGVVSTQRAADEVHVFSGLVSVRLRHSASEEIELETREARKVQDGDSWGEIAFQPGFFFTELEPRYLHWSFDGDEPFDVSGTLAAAPVIKSHPVQSDGRPEGERLVPGKHGKALLFDGRGDRLKTDWRGLGGMIPRTLACWIKVPPGSSIDPGVIVEWGERDVLKNSLWRVRLVANEGHGACLRISYGKHWADGTMEIADGKWHHIAVSDGMRLDASGVPDVRLYVDGNEQERIHTGEPDQPRTAVTSNLGIGMPSPESNQQLHCLLDELFIFDQELGKEAIRRLMTTHQP